MAAPPRPDFLGLLRALLAHDVTFCIVGGVAAQLAGAPILTLDLDILIDTAPDNLDRLLALLKQLNARYRDPAGRHIEPDLSRLQTLNLHLLLTDLGALDLLATIGPGYRYSDLVGRTDPYQLGTLSVRVLDLATVIETKLHANRDKDRAVLPILQQTLALRTKPSV